jgi:hypothetical protein
MRLRDHEDVGRAKSLFLETAFVAIPAFGAAVAFAISAPSSALAGAGATAVAVIALRQAANFIWLRVDEGDDPEWVVQQLDRGIYPLAAVIGTASAALAAGAIDLPLLTSSAALLGFALLASSLPWKFRAWAADELWRVEELYAPLQRWLRARFPHRNDN